VCCAVLHLPRRAGLPPELWPCAELCRVRSRTSTRARAQCLCTANPFRGLAPRGSAGERRTALDVSKPLESVVWSALLLFRESAKVNL
jgi:hypothetical protein